jgi:hypothetical protein
MGKEALAVLPARAWQDHSPALARLSLVGLLSTGTTQWSAPLRFTGQAYFSMNQARVPERTFQERRTSEFDLWSLGLIGHLSYPPLHLQRVFPKVSRGRQHRLVESLIEPIRRLPPGKTF